MANPSAPVQQYVLAEMFQRLTALEVRVAGQGVAPRVTVEVATVSAYTSLSSTCTVEYPGGETRVLPFLTTYTPVVGNVVTVINSSAKSFVDGEISA